MIVTRPCDWLPAPAERSPEPYRSTSASRGQLRRRCRGGPRGVSAHGRVVCRRIRSRRRSAARQCRRCADTNASQAARTPPAATSSSHRKSIASCAPWPSRPTRSVSWWSWSCALAGRLPFDKDSAACSAWSRHTTTVRNDASCSRRPETATRNMARAIPPSTVAEQLLEVNGAFSIGPPKSAAGRRTSPCRPSWSRPWPSTYAVTRPSRPRRPCSESPAARCAR
jgi:hypothetical protein